MGRKKERNLVFIKDVMNFAPRKKKEFRAGRKRKKRCVRLWARPRKKEKKILGPAEKKEPILSTSCREREGKGRVANLEKGKVPGRAGGERHRVMVDNGKEKGGTAYYVRAQGKQKVKGPATGIQ